MRPFSLDAARRLLPTVRELTAQAVRKAEVLATQLEGLPESDPEHARLVGKLTGIVNQWTGQLRELDVEAKGLWLVDFDNGQGYYCWRYPEETISHFHTYEGGFAGRMKIV